MILQMTFTNRTEFVKLTMASAAAAVNNIQILQTLNMPKPFYKLTVEL